MRQDCKIKEASYVYGGGCDKPLPRSDCKGNPPGVNWQKPIIVPTYILHFRRHQQWQRAFKRYSESVSRLWIECNMATMYQKVRDERPAGRSDGSNWK